MSEILENEQRLSENEYPGRGIIQGLAPDGESAIQMYWLTGRSEGSRNRILEETSEGTISTKPFETIEGEDHRLTIYNAMRETTLQSEEEAFPAQIHVVSNGHQTDSAFNKMSGEKLLITRVRAFGEALLNWGYENDEPSTPRISGMVYIQNQFAQSAISIIKLASEYGEIGRSIHVKEFLPTPEIYEKRKGLGECVHTYDGDGNPVPSFSGEPYPVGLEQTAEENAEKYAEILAGDNFVSLVAKAIPLDGSKPTVHIINKNQ